MVVKRIKYNNLQIVIKECQPLTSSNCLFPNEISWLKINGVMLAYLEDFLFYFIKMVVGYITQVIGKWYHHHN